MSHDIDPLFRGVKVPAPVDDRRERDLAAAFAQAGVSERVPALSLIDHLWTSLPLRTAWAAALLLIVAGHAALRTSGAPLNPTPSQTSAKTNWATEQEREFEQLTAWATPSDHKANDFDEGGTT